MRLRVLLLGLLTLVTMPAMSPADEWTITPGKGALTPDKTFSGEVTAELEFRGLDWGPWTALSAVENPDAVPTARKNFVSPDQKFSLQTSIEDSQFYFVIKSAQTGQVNRVASANFPVLALAWSPDSQSILAVVHSPMTSFIKIIHWDGSAWMQFDIFPPEAGADDDRFHVVGWEFKVGFIEAAYIVDHWAKNPESVSLYRSTFRIAPATGIVSHAKKAPISQKEYISLRNAGN